MPVFNSPVSLIAAAGSAEMASALIAIAGAMLILLAGDSRLIRMLIFASAILLALGLLAISFASAGGIPFLIVGWGFLAATAAASASADARAERLAFALLVPAAAAGLLSLKSVLEVAIWAEALTLLVHRLNRRKPAAGGDLILFLTGFALLGAAIAILGGAALGSFEALVPQEGGAGPQIAAGSALFVLYLALRAASLVAGFYRIGSDGLQDTAAELLILTIAFPAIGAAILILITLIAPSLAGLFGVAVLFAAAIGLTAGGAIAGAAAKTRSGALSAMAVALLAIALLTSGEGNGLGSSPGLVLLIASLPPLAALILGVPLLSRSTSAAKGLGPSAAALGIAGLALAGFPPALTFLPRANALEASAAAGVPGLLLLLLCAMLLQFVALLRLWLRRDALGPENADGLAARPTQGLAAGFAGAIALTILMSAHPDPLLRLAAGWNGDAAPAFEREEAEAP